MEPMSEPIPNEAAKATFGFLSLLVFIGTLAVALYFFVKVSFSFYMTNEEFGRLLPGLIIVCFLSVLSVLFAVASLIRHEQPRWPSILGLIVASLPALGSIGFLIKVHW